MLVIIFRAIVGVIAVKVLYKYFVNYAFRIERNRNILSAARVQIIFFDYPSHPFRGI